ncbi:hypothetical protein AC1031_003745 [Aphanomyces cochlioides]|nr:hypothetical protein AC1031_003745 [Aphanomyces cochlioides]
MLLTDVSPIQNTLTDTPMMAQSDTKLLFSCQICFEDVDRQNIATEICGSSCRASVCTTCLQDYIRVQTESVPMGVLAKLKCPICIRPANLLRWKERCVQATEMIDTFAERVGASCNVLCPNCHSPSNVLPRPLERDQTNTDDSSDAHLLEKLSALEEARQLFCHHEIPVDTLCDIVGDRFPDYYTELTERLVPLITDTERRATLFLRLTRAQPFIQSSCCKADICFNCKTKGHHFDTSCEAMVTTKEDVSACPSCHLTLVKGDGCDWVTCFCGFGFYWTWQLRSYRWSQVPRRSIDALTALVRSVRYLRHLRSKVLPPLIRHVNIPKYKKQYLVVCEYLRVMAQRRRVKKKVLPALRAHVIMKDIAKHKKTMLAVCEYLRCRVWRSRLVKVFKSQEFHQVLVKRRVVHCATKLQELPQLKAPMVASTRFLFKRMIQRRKRYCLSKMMEMLAKDLAWIEMTDVERAAYELEQQDFVSTMFGMGEEDY